MKTNFVTQPEQRRHSLASERALPPHANPLPEGEGAPTPGAREAERLRGFESRPPWLPLPRGEGWGEGERIALPAAKCFFAIMVLLLISAGAAFAQNSAKLKNPSGQYVKDVPVVHNAQQDLLEKIQAAKEMTEDPRAAALLENVEKEMKRALELLAKATNSAKPLP